MDKKYRWTIDAELDWGGRSNGTHGLDKGLPLILKAFREAKIKALFFISTEIMEYRPHVIEDIKNEGHELGAHGHFHFCFQEPWRQNMNMNISKKILESYSDKTHFYVRAPKFSYIFYGQLYSDPKDHVSLLKHMWTKQKIKKDSILYLHPFDIVGAKHAPTLFCKSWYSKPKKAYETFLNLVNRYPHSYIHEG